MQYRVNTERLCNNNSRDLKVTLHEVTCCILSICSCMLQWDVNPTSVKLVLLRFPCWHVTWCINETCWRWCKPDTNRHHRWLLLIAHIKPAPLSRRLHRMGLCRGLQLTPTHTGHTPYLPGLLQISRPPLLQDGLHGTDEFCSDVLESNYGR